MKECLWDILCIYILHKWKHFQNVDTEQIKFHQKIPYITSKICQP